jgi:hypothetical protein
MEGEVITTQDVFTFEPQVTGASSNVAGAPPSQNQGRFKSTGLVPSFIGRLRAQGLDFPSGFFS